MAAFKDITGQKFGRLTVLRRMLENGLYGEAMWECRCDCGNTKVTAGISLRTNNTKSCGCLMRQPKGTRKNK